MDFLVDFLLREEPRKEEIKTLKGKIKFLQCRADVSVDADAIFRNDPGKLRKAI